MAAVRRYSQHDRARERRADALARECNSGFAAVTIGDLAAAGFAAAEWHCRRGGCHHRSEEFALSRYRAGAVVNRLRWQYVCGECGTKGPKLVPLWRG